MVRHYDLNIYERMSKMNSERLRIATSEDMELLFRWVNDESVRKASFQTELITWETHVEWFERIMKSENIFQFIYECDGKEVGQVRLKIQNETGLISYSIAPEWRGAGKATRMLNLLEGLIKNKYPYIKELTAEVKSKNIASRRVFEKLEYGENAIVYKKRL